MIRVARPGDGLGAEALAKIALGMNNDTLTEPGPFAAGIDEHGGLVPLPYGSGCALVACDGDDALIGLAYTCPPVLLIEAYAELGPAGQRHLTHALAELEMLAVAEHARGAGVGSALLAATEERLRAGGARLLFAKVARDDRKVLRWYRRRYYTLATPREPVVITIAGHEIVFDDGGDGYLLAVKALDPAEQVGRVTARTGSYLTVQPAHPPTPPRSSPSGRAPLGAARKASLPDHG
ncbi:GNAT family N-acetyltransferase [Streptosporangium sp. CA-115845]|uniref:GNAT family N-acetyltransferase n=1 Tax=Streptosporangium sp. CA-115845 TaxID=3240071 RepID=UPI003D8AF11F